MDRGDGLSRMLETSAKHKALPPLGRALDMRDSHPAAEIGDRLLCSGVSTPHSRPIESRTVLAKDGSEGKLLFRRRGQVRLVALMSGRTSIRRNWRFSGNNPLFRSVFSIGNKSQQLQRFM